MILVKSAFAHLLPVGPDRVLAVHAISGLRVTITEEVAKILDYFAIPRRMPDEMAPLLAALGQPLDPVLNAVADLMDRGLISDASAEVEVARAAEALSATHGRDPEALFDAYRRQAAEGAMTGWAASRAAGLADLTKTGKPLTVLLFGECDIQMETDFLRQEGKARGLDLTVATAFADDPDFAAERSHDAIIIGALRARRTITLGTPEEMGGDPSWLYVMEAKSLIEALRARTQKPILLDALPEPTVQPLGLAERGRHGHRNRFRQTNLALADLVETFDDVHLVDTPAILGTEGAKRFVDDGLVSYAHFGSPGWMLQRPANERAAVFDIFPDLAPLALELGADPYGREKVMAKAHLDMLVTLTGHDRKKAIVLDLDGTLWPGVLAETGAPFAWQPEISGMYSYIGLYFGLHEALKTLKSRGIVLVIASKNDEEVVRKLWTYPDDYPRDRLLSLEDFVTWRIDWNDKADNIKSLADELGFAPSSLLFIDDNPIERERVRERLPEVEVWGENPFTLRRQLLDDPRLQMPRLSAEAQGRTTLVKAQLQRNAARASQPDEQAFLAALDVRVSVTRETTPEGLARIVELLQRTTQFNATGRAYSPAELAALTPPSGAVYSLRVSDRFGDHGLSGAAVVDAGVITAFAMSCRVIGLKGERALLDHVVADAQGKLGELRAQIMPTERNGPVRNLYRDNGFEPLDDGWWRRAI